MCFECVLFAFKLIAKMSFKTDLFSVGVDIIKILRKKDTGKFYTVSINFDITKLNGFYSAVFSCFCSQI